MKSNAEASMLDSIDACGSMLLDTIDHLLDYSKWVSSPTDCPKGKELTLVGSSIPKRGKTLPAAWSLG
jgi:hypothetical protein